VSCILDQTKDLFLVSRIEDLCWWCSFCLIMEEEEKSNVSNGEGEIWDLSDPGADRLHSLSFPPSLFLSLSLGQERLNYTSSTARELALLISTLFLRGVYIYIYSWSCVVAFSASLCLAVSLIQTFFVSLFASF
jgi:hypothetical protein